MLHRLLIIILVLFTALGITNAQGSNNAPLSFDTVTAFFGGAYLPDTQNTITVILPATYQVADKATGHLKFTVISSDTLLYCDGATASNNFFYPGPVFYYRQADKMCFDVFAIKVDNAPYDKYYFGTLHLRLRKKGDTKTDYGVTLRVYRQKISHQFND